ncbi:MAG: hypothetical protein ACYCZU_06660 [Devosia sp.]
MGAQLLITGNWYRAAVAVQAADETWQVDGLALPVTGTWTVEVEIRVSDFERVKLPCSITLD